VGRPRPGRSAPSLTLDAGALVAIERGRERMLALLDRVSRAGVARFHIPAGALAQAWRSGARQVRLARFLAGQSVEVVPLDGAVARSAGELCGALGTRDIVDASVALCARVHGGSVVTSDPRDLLRLDPTLSVFAV